MLFRSGNPPGTTLDLDIKQTLPTWFYSGGQKEPLMKDFKEWYQTQFGGKKIWIPEHIGTGSSKDARHTIRLGFAWNEEAKKVVVGFIGQHQKNYST